MTAHWIISTFKFGYRFYMRKLFPLFLITFVLAACGPTAAPLPPATSAPQTLPATWTPTPGPTAIPTFTEIATFTPVPAIDLPASPTVDPLEALSERFQDSLFPPTGMWTAYREDGLLRVVNAETKNKWTLSCQLFDDCSTIYPVRWTLNGETLYFAAVPTTGGGPSGITLVTALGMINVKSGKWEALLPEELDHYYDFAFSPNGDHIAYTLSSGEDAPEPSVGLGILRVKNKKVQQQHTLDEMYAGNILWSPFRQRIVFQVRNTETGSSVVFYDLETDVLKYVVQGEQADLRLSNWSDADNSVMLEERDWLTYARTYWYLNPFTGDLTSARMTATPEANVIVTPTATP